MLVLFFVLYVCVGPVVYVKYFEFLVEFCFVTRVGLVPFLKFLVWFCYTAVLVFS